MVDNQNQPREFDVVLGGESPPVSSAVLGGIQGVKNRFASSEIKVKITAIEDALNYGEAGFDILIEALQDTSLKIHQAAANLLFDNAGEQGKQLLLGCKPEISFTTLKNWKAEEYNKDNGIKNPENTAYIVNFENFNFLLQDPQASKVEALICHLSDYRCRYEISRDFDSYIEALFENRDLLTNLKALFLGDCQNSKYKKSYLGLGDISLILKSYPNLEVLQIRGYCQELECEQQLHSNLKTLIIETLDISDVAIYQFCSLQLPALEYFELWMGRTYQHSCNQTIDSLKPILFGKSFPNLRYLGLRSSDYADAIAEAIHESSFMAESPIIDNLEVLDLSMGSMTDTGLESLINCESIANLHTLNISHNCVSPEFIEEVKQSSSFDCLLITHSQEEMVDRNCSASRYSVLHE
jgi:hypothetical protein